MIDERELPFGGHQHEQAIKKDNMNTYWKGQYLIPIEEVQNWLVLEEADTVTKRPVLVLLAKSYLAITNKIRSYQQWINDLQSKMYINCVYCGRQYGPRESTPTSMANILKEHVEQCIEHPMNMLKKENEKLRHILAQIHLDSKYHY